MKILNKNQVQKKTAFSFIEMAVVMIIVGILITLIINRSYLLGIASLSSLRTASVKSPVYDLVADNSLWIDVANKDSMVPYPKNKDFISSFTESALSRESHFVFVQNTSNLQPQFLFDSKDNLPLLRFNGDSMTTSSNMMAYDLVGLNQVTAFVVQRYDSDGGVPYSNSSILVYGDQFGISPRASDDKIYFDFGDRNTVGRASASLPADFDNKWKIMTFAQGISGSRIRVNGQSLTLAQSAVTTAFDMSNSATLILSRPSLNVDLREIIIFKRELSDDEIIDVERYLSNKWKINID